MGNGRCTGKRAGWCPEPVFGTQNDDSAHLGGEATIIVFLIFLASGPRLWRQFLGSLLGVAFGCHFQASFLGHTDPLCAPPGTRLYSLADIWGWCEKHGKTSGFANIGVVPGAVGWCPELWGGARSAGVVPGKSPGTTRIAKHGFV